MGRSARDVLVHNLRLMGLESKDVDKLVPKMGAEWDKINRLLDTIFRIVAKNIVEDHKNNGAKLVPALVRKHLDAMTGGQPRPRTPSPFSGQEEVLLSTSVAAKRKRREAKEAAEEATPKKRRTPSAAQGRAPSKSPSASPEHEAGPSAGRRSKWDKPTKQRH